MLTEDEELDVLYHDASLIAVHKPSGLLVHRSPIDKHETRFALQIVRNQVARKVYPVHRLDKPTSGVLLFAFDAEVARALGLQFQQRQVTKVYQALVRGFTDDQGDIDHPLLEEPAFTSQKARPKTEPSQCAQAAHTAYRALARFELPFSDGRHATRRYTLLELSPKTGRRHQLRRHMKHISHPIVGDVKHGKGEHNRFFRVHFNSHRLLLAARSLALRHPVSGDALLIESPLAAEFAGVLQGLAAYQV